jgi:hypothetical protein
LLSSIDDLVQYVRCTCYALARSGPYRRRAAVHDKSTVSTNVVRLDDHGHAATSATVRTVTLANDVFFRFSSLSSFDRLLSLIFNKFCTFTTAIFFAFQIGIRRFRCSTNDVDRCHTAYGVYSVPVLVLLLSRSCLSSLFRL